MIAYFSAVIREHRKKPGTGLIAALLDAEVDGARLREDEVVANTIVTMVGGQETTTNLIGNGLLTLLRHPDQLSLLRRRPEVIKTAIEELLRFESPSQHTARIAPSNISVGGKNVRKGDATIAVMAAANRDPRQFPDPDRLDLTRSETRQLAFGWAAHFCFGAPLARVEAQIAFQTLLKRLTEIEIEPGPLAWRENLGLRGLKALPVRFAAGRVRQIAEVASP